MFMLEDLKVSCLRIVDEELTVSAVGPLLEIASSRDLFKDISKICMEFAVKHLAAFAKSESFKSVQTPGVMRELIVNIALQWEDDPVL